MKPNGCCDLHKVITFPTRCISQFFRIYRIYLYVSVVTCSKKKKKDISTVTVHKLLCSCEIFPSGYVINYKTCTSATHSSPCPFAPFVFASTFISLYSLALSSAFSPSLSLSSSPSPHFTSSFCLLCVPPFNFFSFIPCAALFLIYGYSSASAVYLRVSVSLHLSRTLTSLCVWSFCTEDSLVLLWDHSGCFHVEF